MSEGISLPKGTYLQRDKEKVVLKAHVAHGFINKDQFHVLREVMDEHPDVWLRLLIRQNFRFYDVTIPEADGMRERLEAVGFVAAAPAGGLCINENAGLFADEAFDIFPYYDALAEWVNTRAAKDPNGIAFPGKLKVTMTSDPNLPDNAAYGDLVFLAKNHQGAPVFDILGGGSLGAQPRLAVLLKENVPVDEMLKAANALRALFFEMFEDVHIGKKRMRFQIKKMGEATFVQKFAEHFEKAEKESFTLKEYLSVERPWGEEPEAANESLIPTSFKGIYSLQLPMVRGVISRDLLHLVDNFLQGLDHPVEMGVTSRQSLLLRDLSGKEAEALLKAMDQAGIVLPKNHLVACVSAPTCKFGLARNERLANAIASLVDLDLPEIAISGCMNSCASHQMTPIGFWGKRMDPENPENDLFEITIGGERPVDGQVARLGENGGSMTVEQILMFLPMLAEAKKASGLTWSAFCKDKGEDIRALVNQVNN